MATFTQSVTENASSSYKSTWTWTCTGSDQVVSGSTFTITKPTVTAKYVRPSGSSKNHGAVFVDLGFAVNAYANLDQRRVEYLRNPAAMTSGTTYTISGTDTKTASSLSTSAYFNSNNPTVKTLDVYGRAYDREFQSDYNESSQNNSWGSETSYNLGVVGTITLNAPPSFTASTTSSGTYYVGVNPYTVSVSNSTAQYDGTISEVKLTFGSQTVTRSNDGTLTLTPNTAGTFTPTVSVTDSRGQVTTKSLDAVTINPMSVSISNLSASRINSSGALSDTGENAVITATINYTKITGNYMIAPTLTVNGNSDSNITWYATWSSGSGFSNAVNWTNYAPNTPITLYGKATSTFSESSSYQIGITAHTTYAANSTEITTTLRQAFYLLVGRAGGKGLGIGMKPTTDALHIGMEQHNYDDITADGDVIVGGGISVGGDVVASGDVFADGKSLKYTPTIGSANGQSMESVNMYTDGTYAFGFQFKTDANNGDPNRQYNLYAMDYHSGYNALRLRDATDGVNIWTLHEIVTDTFTFSGVSYTAGTIGTRGAQKSVNISKTGYRAISATIGSISDSTAFIPAVFFNSESSPTILYGNFYRTSTSAKSNLSMTVIVTYMSL